MSISAKINTSSTIQGSVSQGNQPQVTRVTVPGPKGDSGAAGGKLVELADVNAASVSVITNVVETDTGTIRLNGGTF
jgi:hypothetical protein